MLGPHYILNVIKTLYSSPRNKNHSKTPTGKYVVPHDWRRIVNPNGEKQRGIPEKNLWEPPIPRKIRVGAKKKEFRGASGKIPTKIIIGTKRN